MVRMAMRRFGGPMASALVVALLCGPAAAQQLMIYPSQEGEQLILQGVQEGLGWSLSIAKKNGAMALTVSGDDLAFVIFGACTAS